MIAIDDNTLTVILVALAIPAVIVFAYTAWKFVEVSFALINYFSDALEWRANEWIADFKFNRKRR